MFDLLVALVIGAVVCLVAMLITNFISNIPYDP